MTDRIPDFRVSGINRKMGLGQVEQGFSSFFAQIFFGIFDDFSKFCSAFGHAALRKNHHRWQKFGKIEDKINRVQLIKKPFLYCILPNTRNPGTRSITR